MINVILPESYIEHDLISACLIEIFREEEINLLVEGRPMPNDQADETIRLDNTYTEDILELYGKEYLAKTLKAWKPEYKDYDDYIEWGFWKLKEVFMYDIITKSILKGLEKILTVQEEYTVILPIIQGLVYDICIKTKASLAQRTKDITAPIVLINSTEGFFPSCVKYLIKHCKDGTYQIKSFDQDFSVNAVSHENGCILAISNQEALFDNLPNVKRCAENSLEAAYEQANG